jgi:hypothetical protein
MNNIDDLKFSWFEPGFDQNVKDLILNYGKKTNRFGIPACHIEAAIWYKILTEELKINPSRIKIARGLYNTKSPNFYGEPNSGIEHFWLLIDGKIFDPTAKQFGLKIYRSKYKLFGTKKLPAEWANKTCSRN